MSNTKKPYLTREERAFFDDCLRHVSPATRAEIEADLPPTEEARQAVAGVGCPIERVKKFILRTHTHILDIDYENTMKLLKGENYEFVTKDLFVVLNKGV